MGVVRSRLPRQPLTLHELQRLSNAEPPLHAVHTPVSALLGLPAISCEIEVALGSARRLRYGKCSKPFIIDANTWLNWISHTTLNLLIAINFQENNTHARQLQRITDYLH